LTKKDLGMNGKIRSFVKWGQFSHYTVGMYMYIIKKNTSTKKRLRRNFGGGFGLSGGGEFTEEKQKHGGV
jgi:hypothetical protein